MAGADYYSCDVCGSKAFYDANLNYDFDKRDAHGNPKLDYVGAMVCICDDCAKTHKIEVVAIAAPTDAKAGACRGCDARQAKIDELMFEYCCDEITPEQLAAWEAHQRPVSNFVAQSVRDAAQPIAPGKDKP